MIRLWIPFTLQINSPLSGAILGWIWPYIKFQLQVCIVNITDNVHAIRNPELVGQQCWTYCNDIICQHPMNQWLLMLLLHVNTNEPVGNRKILNNLPLQISNNSICILEARVSNEWSMCIEWMINDAKWAYLRWSWNDFESWYVNNWHAIFFIYSSPPGKMAAILADDNFKCVFEFHWVCSRESIWQ